MKKKVNFLIIGIVLVLSISLISAWWCQDSDEGTDIFTKGVAESDAPAPYEQEVTDWCANSTLLQEAFCHNDGVIGVSGFDCSNGCVDGACAEAPYCTDSDEGKNKFVKGTVTNNGPQTSGKTLTHDDFCWTNSTAEYVMEFFCEGIYQDSEEIFCGEGYVCVDGACIGEGECEDSDGGKNYYVKGEFSGMWQGQQITNTDSCVDALDETGDEVPSSNYLGEGYCENGELKVERLTCPDGCVDGACIGEKECEEGYVCLDSDNPKISIIIRGITYIVQLISASDTSAMIKVNGETKEINEGYAKEVEGLNVYVKSSDEANLMLSVVLKLSMADIEQEEEEEETECDDGCVLDDKCYPYNNRKNGYYCDVGGEWVAQLADGVSCENHFECKSYICASGECIEGSLIQKILAWLKKLFS